MIETRIQGIPCLVEMTSGYYSPPDRSTWVSDVDYYGGWTDVKFKVYDRRGRHAQWLEVKMTEADKDRIIEELINGQSDE